MALQNLRSNTASKRPVPGNLSQGQIALNTNVASTGLFFADASGNLIKAGPVHIGTSAPNSSPAGHTGNSVGEIWLDTTSGNDLKIYDGTAWQTTGGGGSFVALSGDTMTGALILPAGTAAAPSLGVGGTSNGLFAGATNEVNIAISGTERVVINSDGRVGIGELSPEKTLHINGAYAQDRVTTGDIIDLDLSNYFTDTVSSGTTSYNPTNIPSNGVAFSFTLELTYSGGVVNWFSGLNWPGGSPPSLTPGTTYLFMFVTEDAGTNWYGSTLEY